MDGFLLIDKPAGITSHDVVDLVRRASGMRRVGHGGTLDPFATGLLIVGLGKATSELAKIIGSEKEYVGTLVLGASSDTMDLTGKIVPSGSDVQPNNDTVLDVLKKFTGEISQTPPMYSAKKIGGKKLYELAREGKEIERPARTITIYDLRLVEYIYPRLTIDVRCSSGTYIRVLANDIGERLGTKAYLESLRRTSIGQYKIEDAISVDMLRQQDWKTKVLREL